jgi:hypothetical protein
MSSDAAKAWAIACDLRRLIDRGRVSTPDRGLNPIEAKEWHRAIQALDEAVSHVQSIQASLSKRCHASGEWPDYNAIQRLI